MRLANQCTLTSLIVPIECFRPCSEVGANLVPQTEFLQLNTFLVPAVQTRQKAGTSTVFLGPMKW